MTNQRLPQWHKWCFNPSCDGERWQFQFYQNGREVASKEGSNAYPTGYGIWFDFYSSLLKCNGISEIHSCYRATKEGEVQNAGDD